MKLLCLQDAAERRSRYPRSSAFSDDVVVQSNEKIREFSTKSHLYSPIATCSAFVSKGSSIKEGWCSARNARSLSAPIPRQSAIRYLNHAAMTRTRHLNSSWSLGRAKDGGDGRCRRLVELDRGWCVLSQAHLPYRDMIPALVLSICSFLVAVEITCEFDSEYKTFFLTVFSSVYALLCLRYGM